MIEHRKELREKVEERQKRLQVALKESEHAGHPAERISGLRTELSVVADSLGGGWEKMTDVTAEQLSKWLEATRNLVPEAKPIGRHLADPPQPHDAMVDEVSRGIVR